MNRLAKGVTDPKIESWNWWVPRVKVLIESYFREHNVADVDKMIDPLMSFKHLVQQMDEDGEYIPMVAPKEVKKKKKKPTTNQKRLEDLFDDDIDEEPEYNPKLYKHVNIAIEEDRIEGLK